MTTFEAIGIAATGMTVHRKWIDAVSDNLANINDVSATNEAAYQEKYVVARAMDYGNTGGVQVGGVELGDPQGRTVYEPNHPLADENGNVRYPDVDMGSQMSQLIMAQRGYQASAAVVDRARETYTAALQIGKN
ncbi:MAG: flagellar basal body rod protein FlgC [Georgenia sp.]